MSDNALNQFKFVKRRLSVHISISREIPQENNQNKNSTESSPKSPNRRRSIVQQEQAIKKLKEIYIKNNSGYLFNYERRLSEYNEKVLDYRSVEKYLTGSYDKELQRILHILITPYKERTEEDSASLLSFFNKIKFYETIKSDMLITDLSMSELFEYFKPYISGEVHNFMDTIYYRREKSNNLYIVLDGTLGQYKLEKYEEELTCEDYFNFLSDCYNLYEEEMQLGHLLSEKDDPKKSYKISTKSIKDFLRGNTNPIHNNPKKDEEKDENKEQKQKELNDSNYEDDITEQYIDHYLICQMIEENKEIYPLRDISDLVRLKKIIFKLRLYIVLTESSVKDAEILYILYEFPTSYLSFDKVLNRSITVQKYIEILANNFKLYDYFYIKLLGNEKNKVKLMKYIKAKKNLEPYSRFGNYELNDLRAKRDLTVRCESDKCILLSIDKKMYSLAVYNAQKKKREQDIEIMHNCYLFKILSKKYFNNKIFSVFRIQNFFKGGVLIKQYEPMNNFIFIKEGILELSLQNSSFNEFHQLIKEVKEIIIKKAKELKMNQKDLFDFNPEVDSKTNLHMNTIRGILNQKQNFLFHRNENGIFGDFEFFFEIPSILTCTVVSEKCLYYQYDIEKYKQLMQETYLLNESLKTNSFLKLKSLLKRMIIVYNSYWKLSLEQLEKKLKEKEDNMFNNENNNEERDIGKKSFSLSKNIKNIPFFNSHLNNRYTYKNTKSMGGESPFNKMHQFKGFENTFLNNINNNRWLNSSEQNSTTFKFKLNNLINKNIIDGNKNSLAMNNKAWHSGYKTKSKNKKITSLHFDNKKKTKDISTETNKMSDNEKGNSSEFKSINEEEYQRKLFDEFKHEMESQRISRKKIAKKIFLPPLICSFGVESQLNLQKNKSRNNSKKQIISLINYESKKKSKKNNGNDNLNISFVISNSFSGNDSKMMFDNEETQNSNNDKVIKSNINKNKNKSSSKKLNKYTNNLIIVQLYNIISRKEKEKGKDKKK